MEKLIGDIAKKMILYFDGDARRINHGLKVYGFAASIGCQEELTAEEQQILEAAALLHDIGIKLSEIKYNSSSGKYQEIEGPAVARELLADYNFNENILDRICFLIGNHHSYGKIDNKDFQILIEADFIVNINEDEMSREQIKSIKDKYFKTDAGILYTNSIFKCAETA